MQHIIHKYMTYRYIKNSFDPNSKLVDKRHLVYALYALYYALFSVHNIAYLHMNCYYYDSIYSLGF